MFNRERDIPGAWREEGNPHDVPEFGTTAMPSDASASPVFNHKRVLERRRVKTREFRRALLSRAQKVRQFAGLLRPVAVEIIMPTEGDGAALTKEAVEFKFLARQRG
jgi:hypothetical protein